MVSVWCIHGLVLQIPMTGVCMLPQMPCYLRHCSGERRCFEVQTFKATFLLMSLLSLVEIVATYGLFYLWSNGKLCCLHVLSNVLCLQVHRYALNILSWQSKKSFCAFSLPLDGFYYCDSKEESSLKGKLLTNVYNPARVLYSFIK